jgi:hypothetical protein
MNLENPNRLEMSGTPLGELIIATLDDFAAKVSAAWQIQHNEDGTHGDTTFFLGAATGFAVGAGVYMAPSSDRGITIGVGAYDLRVGDPAGNYFAWDGAAGTLTITGTITAAGGTIGGWVIGADYIRSSDAFTGMSSAATVADDVRFWAGGANMNTAPFRVYESGEVSIAAGSVLLDDTGIEVTPGHNTGFIAASSYRFGDDWGMFAEFSDGGPTYTTEILTDDAAAAISTTSLRAIAGAFNASLTVTASDAANTTIITLTAALVQMSSGDVTFNDIARSGTVAAGNAYWSLSKGTAGFLDLGSSVTTSQNVAGFSNANGTIGSINLNGTTTTYNTTSDADLKRDRGRSKDHGTRLAAIVIHDYEFKADGRIGVGVFAQEAYAHAPFAVTPGDPQKGLPWMVDYSKFVPDLIAEVQDHRARLAALEAR